MNRRKFLKGVGAAGASVFIPSSLNLTSLYKHANAAVNYAGALSKVSCEEFYQRIVGKNKRCDNCLEPTETLD